MSLASFADVLWDRKIILFCDLDSSHTCDANVNASASKCEQIVLELALTLVSLVTIANGLQTQASEARPLCPFGILFP